MTGGWTIGYIVGGVVVVVVAVVVLVIIALARRIANNAERITRSIEKTRDQTEALWRLEETHRLLRKILSALRGSAEEDETGVDKAAARAAGSWRG